MPGPYAHLTLVALLRAQAGSTRWGDLQHRGGAMRVLALGVRALQPLGHDARRRRLAWLLGYASHIIADAIVHPVIERLVGDYTASREAFQHHRQCELHQDVFICRHLGSMRSARRAM